jgi:hypothetical protein
LTITSGGNNRVLINGNLTSKNAVLQFNGNTYGLYINSSYTNIYNTTLLNASLWDLYVNSNKLNATNVSFSNVQTSFEGWNFSIRNETSPPPTTDYINLSKFLYINTTSTATNASIYINISYTGSPENEDQLKIYKYNGIDWVEEPQTGVNTTAKVVWANITNISSVYAPLAPATGTLNVSLISPTSPLDVYQDQTFNVSANITCTGGSCGNINGTIFYNLTTTYPNTELNGTVGDKPFYNFTSPVNYSCGTMGKNTQCYVSWLVNATGAGNTNWSLNVTARSSNGASVTPGSTIPNFQVNIIPSPVATLAFSITVPGGNPANISSPTFPGNTTENIWFNATGIDDKYIQPCMATTAPPPTRCQDKAANTPIMTFKNIGNTAFNITMQFNASIVSNLKMFGNFSYASGSGPTSGCSAATLGTNDTVIDTTKFYFTKALCINNETNVFLFANFTYFTGDISPYTNALNYSSNLTG